MSLVYTQTKGKAEFGTVSTDLTDYSAAVTSVDIGWETDQVEVPATLATGEVGMELGSLARTLTINSLSELALAGLLSELEDAFEDNVPLYFELTLREGAVSETNPLYSGQILVGEIEIGGEPGSIRQQNRTYDIKAGTFQYATST